MQQRWFFPRFNSQTAKPITELTPQPPHRERMLQCLVSAIAVGIVLIFIKNLNMLTVASFAGTVCNLFVTPHGRVSRPRNVMLGYTLGIIFGILGYFLAQYVGVELTFAVVVGLAILFMLYTDAMHPPAVASVLGIAIASAPLMNAVSLILSVLPIVIMHNILKQYMRDVL
ncbi:MAG: HPP family protein [Chloroflexales bacterium]